MENFIAEAFALLAIGLVVIGVRLFAKLQNGGISKLQPDDYLMVLAGLLYTAETVAAYCVGAYWMGLANSDMTPEQRAALSPDSLEYHLRVNGSITQLLGWTVYTCLLWTLKGCMLIFYSRLTDKVFNLRMLVRIGAFLLPTTFFIVICVIWFGCHPVPLHWQINPDPGAICYPTNSSPTVYTLVVLNICTDFFLMAIPLPMIWAASLTLKRKIFLFAMFTGGLCTTVFGLLRCILILVSGPQGPEIAGEWSVRESFVAVVVSNMPMVYPFLAQHLRRFKPTTKKGPPATSDSYPLSVGSARNTNKFMGRKSNKYASYLDSKQRADDMGRFGDEEWGSKARIVQGHHGEVTVTGNGGGIRQEQDGVVVVTDLKVFEERMKRESAGVRGWS